MDTDFLSELLAKTHNIVRYYRVGPLGDIPSINGKVVEEALRKVMVKAGTGVPRLRNEPYSSQRT